MAFFEKLFGKRSSPPRSEWLRISTTIAEGFESSRSWWRQAAGELLNRSELLAAIPSISSKILEGTHADLAMRAFQLRDTAGFLAAKSYISPQDGHDFADILWGQVAGVHVKPVFALVQRYEEVANEPGTVLARFLFDVGSYFYGSDKAALAHSLALGELFEVFVDAGRTIVAGAFGDHATVRTLAR
jgi:hypothetical protein